jgi:hypothetical protein
VLRSSLVGSACAIAYLGEILGGRSCFSDVSVSLIVLYFPSRQMTPQSPSLPRIAHVLAYPESGSTRRSWAPHSGHGAAFIQSMGHARARWRAPPPTTALPFDRPLLGVRLCYRCKDASSVGHATWLRKIVSDRPRRMIGRAQSTAFGPGLWIATNNSLP